MHAHLIMRRGETDDIRQPDAWAVLICGQSRSDPVVMIDVHGEDSALEFTEVIQTLATHADQRGQSRGTNNNKVRGMYLRTRFCLLQYAKAYTREEKHSFIFANTKTARATAGLRIKSEKDRKK